MYSLFCFSRDISLHDIRARKIPKILISRVVKVFNLEKVIKNKDDQRNQGRKNGEKKFMTMSGHTNNDANMNDEK